MYRLTAGSEVEQDISEAVYSTTRGRSLRGVVTAEGISGTTEDKTRR